MSDKAKKTHGKTKFGVHSEVGKLHKVMVCAPGRAHNRLTPVIVMNYCLMMCCGWKEPSVTTSIL